MFYISILHILTHIFQLWHLFCLFTFWYGFYFRAPHLFFLSMFNKACPTMAREIYFCVTGYFMGKPLYTFQSVFFFFFAMGMFLSNNTVSHCSCVYFTHWLGLFVCTTRFFPLFVLSTKADQLFIYEKETP